MSNDAYRSARSAFWAMVLMLFAGQAMRGQEPPAANERMEIERLIAEGKRLYYVGQFVDSITTLKQALEKSRMTYPTSQYPQGHQTTSDILNELGNPYREAGKFDLARSVFEESLAMDRRLFPKEKYPEGHARIAITVANLAATYQQAGQPEKAKGYYEEALAMQRKVLPKEHKVLAETLAGFGLTLYALNQLDAAATHTDEALAIQKKLFTPDQYPSGHINIATSLSVLALIEHARGQPAKALPFFEEALAMNRKLYPLSEYATGHANLATSINNVAAMHQLLGRLAFALPLHEESLVMRRRQYPESKYPKGHADIVQSLHNLCGLCSEMRLGAKAIEYGEQAVAMATRLFPKEQFPDGHPDFAGAYYNLSAAFDEAGQSLNAVPPGEQALGMYRKLFPESRFPNGHPSVAQALVNVGVTYSRVGQSERGLPLLEQALAMKRKLYPAEKYPNGHPELASNLNGLGYMLSHLQREAEALEYYRQALAMREKLYPPERFPNGHTDLAVSYGNVGKSLLEFKQHDEAVLAFDKSLQVFERLYSDKQFPNGHPNLVRGIYQRGAIEWARGHPEAALPYFHRAATLQSRYLNTLVPLLAEAPAFQLMARMTQTQNAYLGCTRVTKVSAAEAYAQAWTSKAMLSRILERRHLAGRVAQATNPQIAKQWEQLAEVRQEIARVINKPHRTVAVRDAYLKDLNERRQGLERSMAAALPALDLTSDRTGKPPADLLNVLPPRTVFLDIIAYTDVLEPNRLHYAVFILAKGQPIERVDLADADIIDRAIGEWRESIQRGEDRPATLLRDRLWKPLQPHLPADTATVYISADRALNTVPWAALPGDKPDTRLLEQYAFAVVPHGTFLMQQLTRTSTPALSQETVLMGGLRYDSAMWPELPGTRKEINAILPLSPKPPVQLTEASGTPERLRREMPGARFVHLATHGFFAEKEFLRDHQRTQEMLQRVGTVSFDLAVGSGAAQQSRLAYTGLVLSGGEVFTGENIVDLALDRIDLCVLSACETGQGAMTNGEGVFGLTRAFHLAGCPNVVASLWKVNDDATAALMVKFYHELWVNKKPPIEALRDAQLTIYRRRDLIPVLAAERGIKLEKAIEAASAQNAPAGAPTTPTKLWAAFVLSGVGN